MSSSTSEKIYSGAATIGRIQAIISVIFGSLIGVGLIAGGIYMIRKKDEYTGRANATVQSITCDEKNVSNNVNACIVTLTFKTPQGGVIEATISTTSIYKEGQVIDISYDQSNPRRVSFTNVSNKTIGYVMLGFGAVMVLGLSLYYYFVMRYKEFAAVQGALGVTNAVLGRNRAI